MLEKHLFLGRNRLKQEALHNRYINFGNEKHTQDDALERMKLFLFQLQNSFSLLFIKWKIIQMEPATKNKSEINAEYTDHYQALYGWDFLFNSTSIELKEEVRNKINELIDTFISKANKYQFKINEIFTYAGKQEGNEKNKQYVIYTDLILSDRKYPNSFISPMLKQFTTSDILDGYKFVVRGYWLKDSELIKNGSFPDLIFSGFLNRLISKPNKRIMELRSRTNGNDLS